MHPSASKEEMLFAAALAQSTLQDRAAYLVDACAGDEALFRRLQELLRAHEGSVGPLDTPPAAATVDVPLTECPGDVIGSYKLLQEIGQGGMGVVYMAEQTEPVRRKVALKIIKPGMDTRQVIARFEAERQALSLMDHPNIAKVLDAGSTQSGRPYFVMELVKGQPITQYCDEKHLTPRERLQMLLPICHAIQHAHQKGIIHRDIKPTNILVAEYDEKPVPKVIDFGVAKAISQPLTEKTMFTGFGQIVGTIEYMSPEQAKVNQLDIDTRSDVYSLGVLMYELLTGTTPFDKERLRLAAWDEMLRIIREEDPPKPSTRLSDSKDSLPSISAQRQTEPARLTKLVRGELDWIVMKALEKDRSRRYETANGFAADVERYLNDEPVLACPPSAAYRFRKFVRRNKGSLAVSVLVLFFLILLGSGAGWAVRDWAAREAELARERAARFARLNQEVEAALVEAETLRERALTFTENPYQWEAVLSAARSSIRRASSLATQEPEALEAEVEARLKRVQTMLDADEADRRFVARFDEILLEQTEIHGKVSRFKFELAYPALKESFLAHYAIDVGITSKEQVVGVIRKRPEAIQEKLLAALDHSLVYLGMEETQTRQWLIAVLETADPDPWRNQARQALAAHDWSALEKQLQDPIAARQPPTYLSRLALALPNHLEHVPSLTVLRQIQHSLPDDFWANHNLACVLHYRNPPQLDEAIRYYTAALALRPRHPVACVNLGNALSDKGDLEGAITAYRDAVDKQPDYVGAHECLILALLKQGKLNEAIDAYQEALESTDGRLLARTQREPHSLLQTASLSRAEPRLLARTQRELHALLQTAGRKREAEQLYHQARVNWEKYAENGRSYSRWELAWFLVTWPDPKLHDAPKAIELAEQLVKEAPDVDYFWRTLGAAYLRSGDWPAAIAALEKSNKLVKHASAWDAFFLAMAHWQQGDKDEALMWYDRGVEHLEQCRGHADIGEILQFQAEAGELLGITDEPKSNEAGTRPPKD